VTTQRGDLTAILERIEVESPAVASGKKLGWFVSHFNPGSRPFDPWGGLCAFARTFDDARKGRQDFAMFREANSHGDIIALYFSPSAEHFANLFNAVGCQQPNLWRVALLAGDQACWDSFANPDS
jgi:hypothetical protein